MLRVLQERTFSGRMWTLCRRRKERKIKRKRKGWRKMKGRTRKFTERRPKIEWYPKCCARGCAELGMPRERRDT